MTQGDIPGAAFHLAGAVPILGPMTQQFSQDIAGGNAPEAIGHGLGIGAMLKGPGMAERTGDIVNAAAERGIQSPVTVGPPRFFTPSKIAPLAARAVATPFVGFHGGSLVGEAMRGMLGKAEPKPAGMFSRLELRSPIKPEPRALPAWMEQSATEVPPTTDVSPIRGPLPSGRGIPSQAERVSRAESPAAAPAATPMADQTPALPVQQYPLPRNVRYTPPPEAPTAAPAAEAPSPVVAEPPAPLARPGASHGISSESGATKPLVIDRLADKLEDQDIQARYRREMHAGDIEHDHRAKVSAKLAEAVKGIGVVPETPEQLGYVARERGIGKSYQKGRDPSANTVDLTAEKAEPTELESQLQASIEQAKAKKAQKEPAKGNKSK